MGNGSCKFRVLRALSSEEYEVRCLRKSISFSLLIVFRELGILFDVYYTVFLFHLHISQEATINSFLCVLLSLLAMRCTSQI